MQLVFATEGNANLIGGTLSQSGSFSKVAGYFLAGKNHADSWVFPRLPAIIYIPDDNDNDNKK